MSSIGAFLQLAAFLLMAAYLLHSLFRGKKAPANPWGGSTLEWTCPSPPPHDNFPEPPSVGRPYDHHGLEWDEETEGLSESARNSSRMQVRHSARVRKRLTIRTHELPSLP